MDEYLAVDVLVHDVATVALARRRAHELRAQLQKLQNNAYSPTAVELLLKTVLEDARIDPPAHPSTAENTITSALVDGRGSCAALVATVLTLRPETNSRLIAVVLRDHVLLGIRDTPDLYFELLEGGRRLEESDLGRYGVPPPGGPTRVSPEGFLPYYLDNLAARLADDGQNDSAETAFRDALALAPTAARIHYNFGTMLLRSERFAQAEVHLRRAIKLGWNDAAAYVNRGVARWQQGRLKAARRDFQHALRLDPDNREAKTNLRKLAENPGGD